jgi:type I restriction enzyme S subunit
VSGSLDNWVSCEFGEISNIVGGGTPPSKDVTNFVTDNGIPWITPADLSGYKLQYITRGARNLSPKGFAACSAVMLPKGSVLFSSRAPVGYVVIAANPVCTNQGFKSFVLPSEIDSRFVYYYLRFIKPLAEERATGTTFKELSGAAVAKLPMLLAPFNEQKRIADKLDAVLARVDACRERLARLPAILKRFRQSVLTAAASGELTEEWRKERDRDLSSWQRSTVGALIDAIEAGVNVRCEERPPLEGERGLVKISAVTWGTYDDEESKTLPAGKLVPESTRIGVGDFLISRANTLELVGACVIVHNVTRPVFLSDKVLRLVMPDEIKPWLLYIMQSEYGRRQIERLASGNQLSMRNLSQANLRCIEVPLPPEDEREEIVRRVHELFAYADRHEARHIAACAQIERLTPALLAKAFRGELVSQDTNDEPASVLLARIRTARVAGPYKAKRAKDVSRSNKLQTAEVLMLNRKEIKDTHLTTILKNRGPLTPEALWSASQLEIDDFYDQLKDEETRGLLKEQRGDSSTVSGILLAAA